MELENWNPPEGAQRILTEERARPGPDADVQRALWKRLSATLGLPTAAMGASAGQAGKWVSAALRGKLALAGGAFVLGTGVGGGVVAVADRAREPVSKVDAHPPAADAPDAWVQASPVEVARPASTPPPGASPHHGRTPPAGASELAAERALLEEAQTALTRGDAPGCLSVLARHARAFPDGQLVEERDALRIRALVATGDEDGARQHADAFRHSYPDSILQPAIDASLGASR